jgi:hypothetical protein
MWMSLLSPIQGEQLQQSQSSGCLRSANPYWLKDNGYPDLTGATHPTSQHLDRYQHHHYPNAKRFLMYSM